MNYLRLFLMCYCCAGCFGTKKVIQDNHNKEYIEKREVISGDSDTLVIRPSQGAYKPFSRRIKMDRGYIYIEGDDKGEIRLEYDIDDIDVKNTTDKSVSNKLIEKITVLSPLFQMIIPVCIVVFLFFIMSRFK